MGYYVYVKNKKTKQGQPGHWSEKKKLECLTTFLTTGKLSLTSAMTGVPVETLRVWKRSDWWATNAAEMQQEGNIELDQKLTKVMDKALEAVMDRLENGEYMYDPRTGKVKRIPAKLRDTGKILNDMIDKKQLIKKTVRDNTDTKQQITADHLVQLAKAFAEFSTGKKQDEVPSQIIEGEYKEHLEELGVEEGYTEKGK